MPKTKKTKTHQEIGRFTIGWLTAHLGGVHELGWLGAFDEAQAQGVNLVCLSGEALRPVDPHLANLIYDLADTERLDGLVIWASAIGVSVGPGETDAFVRRYARMPLLTLVTSFEGIPSVLLDDYGGMREAIVHLIEVHGCRRLLFIPGPEKHQGARERYRAYTETLAEYDIPFDPHLVAPPSDGWLYEYHDLAHLPVDERGLDGWLYDYHSLVHLLVDERGLCPGVDFDAIVGANENLVLEMIAALRARDETMTQNIAWVGFDDTLASQSASPPLTTVRAGHYQLARQAVRLMVAQLRGETAPERSYASSQLIVRQSCGCLPPTVQQAAARLSEVSSPTQPLSFEMALEARREVVLAAMLDAARDPVIAVDVEQMTQLFDAFVADLAGNDTFLSALSAVLLGVLEAGGEVKAWQNVISTMRRDLRPHLDAEQSVRAEDIWGPARVLIAEQTMLTEIRRGGRTVQQAELLMQIGQRLTATVDARSIIEILSQDLPRLGIAGCYLSLYQDPRRPLDGAKLVLAFREGQRFALQPGGQPFLPRQLIPGELFPQDGPCSLIVEPLYFGEDQLGFIIFETRLRESMIYERLRTEISSALRSALLLEERDRMYIVLERRAVQLQTAAEVSRAASGILDPDDLIRQVVGLIRERFDLYYTGLFLVDQAGEWAVLRAGAGEAGQQMLARGHKLEVGGESMIGWCIAHKRARIALDVGEEAVRFENPLLPETRSELALPLVSRGEAIGALTIQSTEGTAFSEEDVAVLQTMADQVANAIENMRLFNRSQEALREMETLQRRYQQRAWSEFAQAAPVTSYETHRPDRAPLGDEVLPEIQAALERSEPTVLRKPGTGAALVAPITQRGAAIGALGVHLEDARRELTEDELALVQVVAERVGLVAETLRLLDETQRSAAQERLVGEVTSRIRETLDVETVLRTAANEMRAALGLERLQVRLGMPEPDDQL